MRYRSTKQSEDNEELGMTEIEEEHCNQIEAEDVEVPLLHKDVLASGPSMIRKRAPQQQARAKEWSAGAEPQQQRVHMKDLKKNQRITFRVRKQLARAISNLHNDAQTDQQSQGRSSNLINREDVASLKQYASLK